MVIGPKLGSFWLVATKKKKQKKGEEGCGGRGGGGRFEGSLIFVDECGCGLGGSYFEAEDFRLSQREGFAIDFYETFAGLEKNFKAKIR